MKSLTKEISQYPKERTVLEPRPEVIHDVLVIIFRQTELPVMLEADDPRIYYLAPEIERLK